MPQDEEVLEVQQDDNKEGSLDLSDTNNKLSEIINIISSEIELRNKKEEEQKKIEEELDKKSKEEQEKNVEQLEKEKENSVSVVETIVENTDYLESINSLMQEQVFLHKMSFVGLGVGIALVSVLIFQNSFKR